MKRAGRLARAALLPGAAALLTVGVAATGRGQSDGSVSRPPPANPPAAAAPVNPPAGPVAANPPAPPGSPSPSAAAGATPPVAAKPAPPPPNLEPLAANDYTGILGRKIMGPDGKELGLVVDVLVDSRGRPLAAVIDFGGFLGVGSRKIAIDWRLLKFEPDEAVWKISLNLGRAELQQAPEYKPDEATDKMVGPPKVAPIPETDK